MKKETDKLFDIVKIRENLPLTFRDLAVEVFDPNKISTRAANFDNYKSGQSICFHFYKPISKLKTDD